MEITFDQIGLDRTKLNWIQHVRSEMRSDQLLPRTVQERGVISDFRQRRAEN